MTPQKQTIFGNLSGNCFAACIASALDVPIEEVPNFCAAGPDQADWFHSANRYVLSRGYALLCVCDGEFVRRIVADSDCLTMVSGKSPRGDYLHSVLYRGTAMIHDPHPDGTGIVGEPEDWIFFVAREPGRN